MVDRMKRRERTEATEHIRNAIAVVSATRELLVALRVEASPNRSAVPGVGRYLTLIGLEAELGKASPYLSNALSILDPPREETA